MATLDRATGRFHVTETAVSLAPAASMIAYNASNVRHLPRGLQANFADLVAGAEGPLMHDFNMRWLAAAVGELHRILRQRGLFLYPANERAGYGEGRLRLLYEAFPIAFIVEQAGGAATDGSQPILDRSVESLHQNTPLIFGAATRSRRLSAISP